MKNWFGVEDNFGPKLAASLEFEPLGYLETILNTFIIFCTLKNIYLDVKFVDLW